jgi:hypothetical protein
MRRSAAALAAALALLTAPAAARPPGRRSAPPGPAPTPPPDVDLPEFLARATGLWQPPQVTTPPTQGRFSWTLLPFLFANPLMGVGGGAAAIGAFRLGTTPETSYSKFESSAFFTTNGQRGFVLRTDARLPGDDWILVGDWGAGVFPNPAWGLGGDTPASNETIVHRTQLQIHETGYRRITGRLYAGLGLWLDHFYGIEDERAARGETTAFSSYGIGTSGRSFTLGAALSLLYDGRDSSLDPTRGTYLLARYRFEPEWLGNETNWRSLYLDARTYLPIPGRRDVLALWAYEWSSFGATPYLLLPAIGADPEHRSGRGFTEGRYTAMDLLYAEAEYRMHVWQFLSAVAAVNLVAPSERGTGKPGAQFQNVHPGFATGVRLLLDRASRSSIAIDGAWSPAQGFSFYLAANATF